MVFAKKSLGQHFLRSEKALRAIRDAAEPDPFDVILEIGPGEGVLTEHLLPFAGKVIAIEKDDQLYEYLKDFYAPAIEKGRFDLVHGDVLDFDPEVLRFYKDFTYKIVANIPYNITGAIFRKFLSASYQPELMVILVQKEVAERIVAKNNKESILSISIKVYGEPRYVQMVKAGSFTPPPRVDSAIISIENISKDFFQGFSEEKFFELLHAGFASKRKKLSGNLGKLFPREKISDIFQKIGLDDNIRAEDLSISGWRKIAMSLI